MTAPSTATVAAQDVTPTGEEQGPVGAGPARGSLTELALSLPAANEPTPLAPSGRLATLDLPAANEPQPAAVFHRTALEVQIATLSAPSREGLVPIFWRLVGELVAEVLLDGVDESRGATEPPERANLAS